MNHTEKLEQVDKLLRSNSRGCTPKTKMLVAVLSKLQLDREPLISEIGQREDELDGLLRSARDVRIRRAEAKTKLRQIEVEMWELVNGTHPQSSTCTRCNKKLMASKKLKNDLCPPCWRTVRCSIVWLSRYVFGRTLKQCGKLIGVSGSRARGLIAHMDSMIRHRLYTPLRGLCPPPWLLRLQKAGAIQPEKYLRPVPEGEGERFQ